MTFLFFLVVICSVFTFVIVAAFFFLFLLGSRIASEEKSEEKENKTSRCSKCKHCRVLYNDGRVVCDRFSSIDTIEIPDECNEIDSEK